MYGISYVQIVLYLHHMELYTLICIICLCTSPYLSLYIYIHTASYSICTNIDISCNLFQERSLPCGCVSKYPWYHFLLGSYQLLGWTHKTNQSFQWLMIVPPCPILAVVPFSLLIYNQSWLSKSLCIATTHINYYILSIQTNNRGILILIVVIFFFIIIILIIIIFFFLIIFIVIIIFIHCK